MIQNAARDAAADIDLNNIINATNATDAVTRPLQHSALIGMDWWLEQKAGIFKPKIFLAHTEPATVTEALADSNWRKATIEEYQALQKNQTWTLSHLPSNKKAIGCKWVFKIKRNADGSVQRYKMRLVAKGFNQQEGFDYSETFSPVVKPTSIKIVITLALTYKWQINQFDVHSAFLNGSLE